MSSTYDKLMKDSNFAYKFKKKYHELLLSEIICALMENDNKSVRELAREAKLTPSFIQNLRSGKQKDIKLRNFINLTENLGYEVVLKSKNSKDEILLHYST